MAKRFMLTLLEMQNLGFSACEDDMCIVWRDIGDLNIAIRTRVYPDALRPAGFELVCLTACGTRELRLLAAQLEWYANEVERQYPGVEEYDP